MAECPSSREAPAGRTGRFPIRQEAKPSSSPRQYCLVMFLSVLPSQLNAFANYSASPFTPMLVRRHVSAPARRQAAKNEWLVASPAMKRLPNARRSRKLTGYIKARAGAGSTTGFHCYPCLIVRFQLFTSVIFYEMAPDGGYCTFRSGTMAFWGLSQVTRKGKANASEPCLYWPADRHGWPPCEAAGPGHPMDVSPDNCDRFVYVGSAQPQLQISRFGAVIASPKQ